MQGGPDTTWRLVGVVAALVLAGVGIGLYVADYLVGNTPAFKPAVHNGTVNLTIQTVAAVGPGLAPNHPDWVSYLVRDESGTWKRTTVWDLPANATVHVTLYNFDGASGLRNPFFGRPTGIVGPEVVDGKPLAAMAPDDPSHTFAVPALGIVIPVAPVDGNAPESVRLRAVRDVEGAPHDHLHLQDGRARPLPLAVLRSLRRRLHLRLRRPDADDRLHGRVPECQLSRSTAYGRRFLIMWAVASLIATPLVAIFVGPNLPPGHGSVQASGQVTDATVLVTVMTPILLFVVLFVGFSLSHFRAAAGRAATAHPITVTRGSRSSGRS